MIESNDLAMVSALFEVQQFKTVRLKGKGADLEIKDCGDNTIAFCEMKSLQNEFQGGFTQRHYNRLSSHIHKAVGQLENTNPQRLVPNILAFVNHDYTSNHGDLFETLTGTLPIKFESGDERVETTRDVSNARINNKKSQIDAYIWIDGSTGQLHGCFFSHTIPEHTKTICRLLGLDDKSIQAA